ncbi:nose resistant to fluoxetine protein 6-like, partial [Diorhabda sublineata]|uniref:nose resistant to fluoxetine protein 6-like n=1 Tax=Diorhabda sublineata TaxID=1163346 RepID=UPI0024E10541
NQSTPKFTYNSSDLSYLSNGIQFPVPDGESQYFNETSDFENVSQFQWFSKLYDHHTWWNRLETITNNACKSDMMVYLTELSNGTTWAIKMYDASGRYSGQFLFGNDYWLGSKTLCEELAKKEWNEVVPPFDVNFFVSKIRINLNRNSTPVTRQLNVGECLPQSCDVQGVRSLLALERNQANSVNIVGVRKVPGDYSLLSDFKVHLLGGDVYEEDYNRTSINENEAKCHKFQLTENNDNYNSTTNITNGSMDTVVQSGKNNGKVCAIPMKLLISFSAVTNSRAILSVEQKCLESIQCIHGLRFLSIAWIILVHSYLEIFSVSDNKNLRILTERGFMYQTISNATFSVDTFFFISGFLVTLTYFRSFIKKQKSVQPTGLFEEVTSSTRCFVVMIFYRLFRLTPAYLFVLTLNEITMRYLHSNSVFSPAIIDHISCDNYWWRNILYINNFYPQHQFCMLWSWYMANDTQFYVVASILLLIAIRGPKHVKAAGTLIIILLGASWITTFIIATKWDYVARVEEPFALFDQLYDKPWLRIGPYLIGILAGYYMFKVDCKVKMSSAIIAIGWVLSVACLSSLVYGLGRDGLVVPTSAFYASLGHSAWGLSISWITIACCSGYGGIVNSFLSCKFFLPLSRLTYCAYLIHPVLMCLTSFHLDGPLHMHEAMAVVIYFGNLVLSFMSAFLISLAFEAPVVNVLKILFN